MITNRNSIKDQYDDRRISDGRLTAPSDGKKYDLRQMGEKVKELERSLTEEEAQKFIIE